MDRRPSSARALADPSAPWELLWARVDGHTLHGIVKVLQIHESRVFDVPDAERVRKNLLRILALMSHSGATLAPRLHAELTSVIAALFEARQTAVSAFAPDRPAVSPAFQRTIEELSIYYYKSWRVPDLARIAGMSVPQ